MKFSFRKLSIREHLYIGLFGNFRTNFYVFGSLNDRWMKRKIRKPETEANMTERAIHDLALFIWCVRK